MIGELRVARQNAAVSQRALATQLGWSQSEINRLEQFRYMNVPMLRLCEVGAVLGLELGAGWHPAGDAVRDEGHQAVKRRFLSNVASPPYLRTHEAPFPNVGDLRSWDILLRLDQHRVGVEFETRVRDVQACVRRIRARERTGGVDAIVLVLADTAHNRRLVRELREALGSEFATSPGVITAALASGLPVPGSGVVLV